MQKFTRNSHSNTHSTQPNHRHGHRVPGHTERKHPKNRLHMHSVNSSAIKLILLCLNFWIYCLLAIHKIINFLQFFLLFIIYLYPWIRWWIAYSRWWSAWSRSGTGSPIPSPAQTHALNSRFGKPFSVHSRIVWSMVFLFRNRFKRFYRKIHQIWVHNICRNMDGRAKLSW